jgi:hypothetical protein
MGCTELTLIPIAEAMAAPRPMGYVPGAPRSAILGSKDGMRMALSFRATAQRRLRRQTVLASQMPVLALPVAG